MAPLIYIGSKGMHTFCISKCEVPMIHGNLLCGCLQGFLPVLLLTGTAKCYLVQQSGSSAMLDHDAVKKHCINVYAQDELG